MTFNVIAIICVANDVQATIVRECAIFSNVALTHQASNWTLTRNSVANSSLYWTTQSTQWPRIFCGWDTVSFHSFYPYISSHMHRIQAILEIKLLNGYSTLFPSNIWPVEYLFLSFYTSTFIRVNYLITISSPDDTLSKPASARFRGALIYSVTSCYNV